MVRLSEAAASRSFERHLPAALAELRRSMDELLESIEAVSAGDVQRIAQTFFDPKQIALTILGNLENFKIGREDLVC